LIGLDPVQLGLIMVINLGIGLHTPPIGTTLFLVCTVVLSAAAPVAVGQSMMW
jgi:TRAP-type C4-dicarboxylate transport system permease large subunit